MTIYWQDQATLLQNTLLKMIPTLLTVKYTTISLKTKMLPSATTKTAKHHQQHKHKKQHKEI